MSGSNSMSQSCLSLYVFDSPIVADRHRRFRLTPELIRLGRDPDCEISLHDPDLESQQLLIEATEEGVHLTGHSSSTDLWVHDELRSEALLQVGESFRVGMTSVTLVRDELGEAALLSQPLQLANCDPHLLDDSDCVLWLERGALEVFLAPAEKEKPGARHHLCTLKPGGIIIGQLRGQTGVGFRLTDLPGTTFRRLDRKAIEKWAGSDERLLQLAAALQPWILGLSDLASPTSNVDVQPEVSAATIGEIAGWIRRGDLDGLVATLTAEAVQNYLVEQEAAGTEAHRRLQIRAEREQQARREALEALHSDITSPLQPLRLGRAADTLWPTLRQVAHACGFSLAEFSPGLRGETFDARVRSAAETHGLSVRRIALRGKWWSRSLGPLLGSKVDGTPLAVIPRSWGRGYQVHENVEGGTPQVVDAIVARSIDPGAFMIYRPLPPGPVTSRRQLLRFALGNLQREITTLLVCGLLIGALGSLVPLLAGWLIDRAISAADHSLLIQCGLGLLAVSLIVPVLKASENLVSLHLEGRVDLTLQASLWDRLLSLPASVFRTYEAGDLGDRSQSFLRIRTLLARAARGGLLGLTGALFYVGTMLALSPRLTAIAVSASGLIILIQVALAKRQGRWQEHLNRHQGAVTATLLQLLTGIAKIRVAAAETSAFKQWANRFRPQIDATVAAGRWQNASIVLQSVFPVVAPMALFWLAAPSENGDQQMLSIGQFVAFLVAFGAFNAAIVSIGEALLKTAEVGPAYRRVKPLLESQPEKQSGGHAPQYLEGRIRLDHVSFRYRPDGPWTLEGIDLEIRPDELVALVGPSGSGKSTLLRILLGFEFPVKGAVYFDDLEVSTLDLRALRRHFGVVLQHDKPFAADIYQNIVGATAVAHEEVVEALRKAGFLEDVSDFKMGLSTFVGEDGSQLSGGQRQRLMLARALVRRPRILFLDEATSALDNRSQAIVTRSIEGVKATRIVVAHRLSTIRNAHRIVLLIEGKIRAQGTFEDLMSKSPEFRALAQRQLL